MSVLVWFKRDLRVCDHAALVAAVAQAQQAQQTLVALFAFEPAWLQSPDTSRRQIRFFYDAARDLRDALGALGIPLCIHHGALRPLFDRWHQHDPLTHLVCHEETGLWWSYQRDVAVQRWCQRHQVHYIELPQNGVVRRLRSRDGWAAKWAQRMARPPLSAPLPLVFDPSRPNPWEAVGAGGLPSFDAIARELPEDHWRAEDFPEANRRAAEACVAGFLHERALGYSKNISSPNQAWAGCSRISPYLSAGILSVREVFHATRQATAQWGKQPSPELAALAQRSLRSFSARLRWHCHFIQKLEDAPLLDQQPLWSGVRGLRQEDAALWTDEERARFDAWRTGRTGFPMVDACIRCLQQTGWINFRMRSMLVSFASYQLWLHWRETGLQLARWFVDYEPGIHWSQMQMQSGATGINTLRMYSPTKQAHDQDPEGVFIRRWVPELSRVPLVCLAQPWRMPLEMQHAAACVIGKDYPVPIVDEKASLQQAKDVMYGLRKLPQFAQEAAQIAHQHGSRKRTRRTKKG